MPLSQEARDGLRAAVAWNPAGAMLLLSILKEFPRAVKHKDDPYGPLCLILSDPIPVKQIGNIQAIDKSSALTPFPKSGLQDCETFGDEWKAHRFTTAELAAEIERTLSEIGQFRPRKNDESP